jgi:tRNA/tmRNA/rRNA uracil-C5-methylase (TrmA/RlmC/RlmD family)
VSTAAPATGSLVGARLELDVGKVAAGGVCVARHEGRVVFVRHAIPGERVVAVVREGADGDRYLRADAVEVLEASPDRVPEPCPYAGPGRCGGCDWQHVALPAQRRLKAALVEEQLLRLASLECHVEVEAVPTARDGIDPAADDGLNWRTRMQFAVTPAGRLGLRRSRSHELEVIGDEGPCRIAHPDIDELGIYDASWPGVSDVEVAVGPGGGGRLVLATTVRPDGRPELPMLPAATGVQVRRPAPGRGRRVRGEGPLEKVSGRGWLAMPAAGRTWRVSAGTFWQVHPAAAEVLAQAVLDGLEPKPGETALDLYAGVGLFAGVLAAAVAPGGSVVAVESDARAVTDARRNLHELPSVQLVEARVDRALAPGGSVPGAVDLVVLDPPRSGAGAAVVSALTARRPRRIAYVACDPASLARDVATFAAEGYVLTAVRGFDLFPMTQHVECVAILERAEGDGPAAPR